MERVETQGFTMSCMAGTTTKQAKSTISDSGQSEKIGSRKFKALASAFEISVVNQRCSGLNRQVTQSQSSSKSFTCLLESFESIAQLFACFPSIDDGCRADRSFGCKTCCENCTFAC